MNELQIFNNQEFGQIRTLSENNKTLFCGSDVATSLGYKEAHKAIARHCKGGMKHPIPTNGGIQQMLFISEGDLYRLIINSKLPSAEKFEKWVFEEVLPTVRKHGAYMTDETIEKALTSPDFLIQLATQLKEAKEINAKQGQLIGELKPKADYTDRILKNKGLVTITQIAKDYGMSGVQMNKILHRLKVQYFQSGQWLLYRDHQGKGYTHSETIDITRTNGTPDIKMNTKWTQKGRLFLYELLKSEGILPDIEKEEIKN